MPESGGSGSVSIDVVGNFKPFTAGLQRLLSGPLKDITVPVSANTGEFTRSISAASRDANRGLASISTSKSIAELDRLGGAGGRELGRIAASSKVTSEALIGVGGAAVFAGARVLSSLKVAVDAAANLAETTSAATAVFGEAAVGDVVAFADVAAEKLGQSKRQAIDAATGFAVFGKAAGLSGQDLVRFSTDATRLASDLASFRNTTPEEAITAIGAALRGESEPIRRYGVLLDEASLRQEALRQNLISTTREALTPQQRVLAAYALILKQTGDAQGDFERTAGGLANRQRVLAAEMENLKATIGESALPAFEALAAVGQKAFGVFNALPDVVKGSVGAVAVAVGGLSVAGGAISAMVGGLRALQTLGAASGVAALGGASQTAAVAVQSLAVAENAAAVGAGRLAAATGPAAASVSGLGAAAGTAQTGLAGLGKAVGLFAVAAVGIDQLNRLARGNQGIRNFAGDISDADTIVQNFKASLDDLAGRSNKSLAERVFPNVVSGITFGAVSPLTVETLIDARTAVEGLTKRLEELRSVVGSLPAAEATRFVDEIEAAFRSAGITPTIPGVGNVIKILREDIAAAAKSGARSASDAFSQVGADVDSVSAALRVLGGNLDATRGKFGQIAAATETLFDPLFAALNALSSVDDARGAVVDARQRLADVLAGKSDGVESARQALVAANEALAEARARLPEQIAAAEDSVARAEERLAELRRAAAREARPGDFRDDTRAELAAAQRELDKARRELAEARSGRGLEDLRRRQAEAQRRLVEEQAMTGAGSRAAADAQRALDAAQRRLLQTELARERQLAELRDEIARHPDLLAAVTGKLQLMAEQGILTEEEAKRLGGELAILAAAAANLSTVNGVVKVGADATEFWKVMAPIYEALGIPLPAGAQVPAGSNPGQSLFGQLARFAPGMQQQQRPPVAASSGAAIVGVARSLIDDVARQTVAAGGVTRPPPSSGRIRRFADGGIADSMFWALESGTGGEAIVDLTRRGDAEPVLWEVARRFGFGLTAAPASGIYSETGGTLFHSRRPLAVMPMGKPEKSLPILDIAARRFGLSVVPKFADGGITRMPPPARRPFGQSDLVAELRALRAELISALRALRAQPMVGVQNVTVTGGAESVETRVRGAALAGMRQAQAELVR